MNSGDNVANISQYNHICILFMPYSICILFIIKLIILEMEYMKWLNHYSIKASKPPWKSRPY